MIAPGLFGIALLYLWQVLVVGFSVPQVLLPTPSQVGHVLADLPRFLFAPEDVVVAGVEAGAGVVVEAGAGAALAAVAASADLAEAVPAAVEQAAVGSGRGCHGSYGDR